MYEGSLFIKLNTTKEERVVNNINTTSNKDNSCSYNVN